ncbi:hypothetical protein ACFQL4_29015 [Halosimplex aquaticum]
MSDRSAGGPSALAGRAIGSVVLLLAAAGDPVDEEPEEEKGSSGSIPTRMTAAIA